MSPFRFGSRFILFLAPVLAPLIALEVVFEITGESWPVSVVHDAQRADSTEVLFSRILFSQPFNSYKREGIERTEPRILVVGSSRVMRIRSEYFSPFGQAFYNAGGLLQHAGDMIALIDGLESGAIHRPELLLIGIDPWWLKHGPGRGTWIYDEDDTQTVGAHVSAIRSYFKGLWVFGYVNLLQEPILGSGIGLGARLHGNGFKLDGSRSVGLRRIEELERTGRYRDAERPPVIERVLSHTGQFSLPAVVDSTLTLNVIRKLSSLEEAGTEVVVLFQPFSNEVWTQLSSDRMLSGWIEGYYADFGAALEKAGIQVVQVTSPSSFGLEDVYMLDGFHSGAVLDGLTVLKACREAPGGSLFGRVDTLAIKRLISNAESPLALRRPGE